MPNRNFTSPSPELDKNLKLNTEKLKPWLEKFLTHCKPQKRYQHYSILLNETLTNLNNLNSYENTYIYFSEIYLLQNQLFELVGHLDHEKDYDVNFLEPGFREQFYKHTLTMLHWCVTSLISPGNDRINHYYGKSINETLDVISSSSLFSRHFVDVFNEPEETTSLVHTFDWVFAYLKLLLLPPASENIQFHDIDHRKESKPIKSLKDLRGNPQDGQALANYIRLEISAWDDLAVTNFFTQNQHNFHAIKTYIHTNSSELFTHEKNEHLKTLMERLLCYTHSIEDESPEELIVGLKLLQEAIPHIPKNPHQVCVTIGDENTHEIIPDTDPRWNELEEHIRQAKKARHHTSLEKLILAAKKIPAELHKKSFCKLIEHAGKNAYSPHFHHFDAVKFDREQNKKIRKIARKIKRDIILRFPNNHSYDVITGDYLELSTEIYHRDIYLDYLQHLPAEVIQAQRENDLYSLNKKLDQSNKVQRQLKEWKKNKEKIEILKCLQDFKEGLKKHKNDQNQSIKNFHLPDNLEHYGNDSCIRMIASTIKMLHTDITPDAFCIEIEHLNNQSDFVEDQNCISETIQALLNQRTSTPTNSSYSQKVIEILNQKLESKITKKSTPYLNGILGIHKQQYSRINKEIETIHATKNLCDHLQTHTQLIEKSEALQNYISQNISSAQNHKEPITEDHHIALDTGSIASSKSILYFNTERPPSEDEIPQEMVNGVVEKQLINPLTRAHFGIFELKQLKQQKIPFGIDPTQSYGYQSLLHCTTADTYRLNQLSEEQALIIETSEETPAFTQERQQNRQHQTEAVFQTAFTPLVGSENESPDSQADKLAAMVQQFKNERFINRYTDMQNGNILNMLYTTSCMLESEHAKKLNLNLGIDITKMFITRNFEISNHDERISNFWIVKTFLLISKYLHKKSYEDPGLFFSNAYKHLLHAIDKNFVEYTANIPSECQAIPDEYDQVAYYVSPEESEPPLYTLKDIQTLIEITNYLKEATSEISGQCTSERLAELQENLQSLTNTISTLALRAYLDPNTPSCAIHDIEKELFITIGPTKSAHIKLSVEFNNRCYKIAAYYQSIHDQLYAYISPEVLKNKSEIIRDLRSKMHALNDSAKQHTEGSFTHLQAFSSKFFQPHNIYDQFESFMDHLIVFKEYNIPYIKDIDIDELCNIIDRAEDFRMAYNSMPRALPTSLSP